MSATLKYEENKIGLSPTKTNHNRRTLHQATLFAQPTPLEEEIALHPKKYLLSKTDPFDNIEYCNSYFCEVTGYRESELIGKPHSIVRHPDMPAAIFELLWDYLSKRKPIPMFFKNLAKDGRYYWTFCEINVKVNRAIDEVEGFFGYQQAAPKHALPTVEALYQKLHAIEKESGSEASYKYLRAYLQEREQTWETYVHEIVNTSFVKRLQRLFTNKNRNETVLTS